MNSQTLYLKYRPQIFSDVLGQNEVVSVLENSLKNNTISHAYLFSGTHGTGKTSIARIFARSVGASKDDIYEIDAASNRGIGEIREIRDSVDIMPLSSDFKVYIIDEAHMLTKEASNALLKTLEEPPKHVVFILATTEKNKVLPTILSRCSVFEFSSPDINILSQLVEDVVKKEGKKIDQESVRFIASLGNKSFRDTLSHLQKIISIFQDKKEIIYSEVKKTFAHTSNTLEKDFLKAFAESDKEKMYEIYYKVKEKSIDIVFFLEKNIESIRRSILIKNSEIFKKKYEGSLISEEFHFLQNIKINSHVLEQALGLVENMKISSNPEVLFEIFLDQI